MPGTDSSPTGHDPARSGEGVKPTAREPQKASDLLPPETDEEWTLFHSLLDEIKNMYDFARERGIAPPDAVIEGLSKLLAVSEPGASEISRPQETTAKPTTSAAGPTT